MSQRVELSGHVPLEGDQFKVLLNNCFTLPEIGAMAASLAGSVRKLLDMPNKSQLKEEINCGCTAVAKLLLALPDANRKALTRLFEERYALNFELQEIQQPDKEHIN